MPYTSNLPSFPRAELSVRTSFVGGEVPFGIQHHSTSESRTQERRPLRGAGHRDPAETLSSIAPADSLSIEHEDPRMQS